MELQKLTFPADVVFDVNNHIQELQAIESVKSDEDVIAVKEPLKRAKNTVKHVEELRKNFTRELDKVKKAAMENESNLLFPLIREAERLTASINAYETAKELERQRILREAEEAQRKERERLEQQGRKRVELVNSLREIVLSKDQERAKKAVDFLQNSKFKAGIYYDDQQRTDDFIAEVNMEFVPALLDLQNADLKAIEQVVKQEAEQVELTAIFESAQTAAFVADTAPEKGKNVQIKEVWSVVNSSAYIALFQFYLQSGGNLEKLNFLVTHAQSKGMKAPLGVKVEKKAVTRI